MAKFSGKIGFVSFEEDSPGVHSSVVVEKPYFGDIVRNMNKWASTDVLHDDVIISNSFSIVGDPYAFDNFFYMRYIIWMGTAWKIQHVDIQPPRLVLSIGGMYNGAQASTTDNS